MRRIVILAVIVAVTLAGVSIVVFTRRGGSDASSARQALYHCPMHPTYTSDKPGDCPICGMKLVPIEQPGAGATASSQATGGRRILYYRSPMDPNVRSDTPKKDEMGMDYVPVYEDEVQGSTSTVPGRATLTISPERRQVLGVRSEPVKRMGLDHRIRTVGRVAIDERRLRHVHTKFNGYVEHLYVDYTGQFVKRGQPLLSIYSPELVATQEEYLLAHRAQASLGSSPVPSAARGSLNLLDAARRRLLLWDISPEDIQRLENTGNVTRTLDLHADIGGYVVQKMAFQGMRVTPADTLYDIADLSHLWVLADVYEYNLPSLALGAAGEVKVAAGGDRTWKGTVTFIAPTVEEQTRTVKVRLEVDNPDGQLKPDMYADVFLNVRLGEGLVVPDGAVINAGDRRLLFVDLGEGRFEPREVKLGTRAAGGGVQVLSGVKEGEQVVTAANFLLDSESSLRAAVAAMTPAGQPPSAPAAPAPPAQHQH